MSILLQNNLAMGGGSSSGQGSVDLSAYRTAAAQDIIDATKQDKLTAGSNITIERDPATKETVISSASKTYSEFPEDFITDQTLGDFVNSIKASSSKGVGKAFLGSIGGDCLPWSGGGAAECKVEYMADEVAVLTVSSSNVAPYHWEYNTDTEDNKWKSIIMQVKDLSNFFGDLDDGAIVQYIGETTEDFINGYFYKIVENAWQQINVQPSGNTSVKNVVQITVEGTSTYENFRIPYPTAEEITAVYNSVVAGNTVQIVDPYNVYYQVLRVDASGDAISIEISYFNAMFITYTLENDTVSINAYKTQEKITGTKGNILYINTNGDIDNTSLNTKFTSLNDPDTESLSGLVETQADVNEEFVALLTNIPATSIGTGYNATKIQVLKNIRGVLTWVDEA